MVDWLRVESSDPSFNEAFEAAKLDAHTLQTLIAVGEWRHAHASLSEPVSTPSQFANIIEEFVFETLGYQPDAEKGRLRLRPKLPSTWSFANVQNIRVGDALVDLRYEHNERVTRYQIEQVSGAMPVRLIFEPVLTVPFSRVLIDGNDAQLNIAVSGSEIIAPVQIMLDAPRVVEFLPGAP